MIPCVRLSLKERFSSCATWGLFLDDSITRGENSATDYKFESPAEIPAGLTNFKMVVDGKEIHHASLIKLEDGKTFEDLMNGFRTMPPDAQPPGWMIPAAGPNACHACQPGTTTALTMVLEPGRRLAGIRSSS